MYTRLLNNLSENFLAIQTVLKTNISRRYKPFLTTAFIVVLVSTLRYRNQKLKGQAVRSFQTMAIRWLIFLLSISTLEAKIAQGNQVSELIYKNV